jgi:hypothetical protein
MLCLSILLLLQDSEYTAKLAAAPQNAKGQYDLAKWCESKKLKAEATAAYQKAIELDPEFEPARKALGQRKVLGRWVSDEIYKDTRWWAHPKVDQKQVDEAVLKAGEYLLNLSTRLPNGQHTYPGIKGTRLRYDELVLLTLLESGWDRKDARLQGLMAKVAADPLDITYHVALKAMCLAAIDPVKYQQQLAQCAQFLVDNQNPNGGWSYGQQVQLPPSFPVVDKGPVQIETGVEAGKSKAKPPKQVEIKKGKSVSTSETDASNSQYAALGLRACLSGLVVVPKEVITAGENYWIKLQQPDGGWIYGSTPNRDLSDGKPYGSMSAGALGSIAIYKYYRNRVWNDPLDLKTDPTIAKGVDWMGKHLDFSKNPQCGYAAWKHYWFYAVERAGRLLETETFGSHEWYPEGAPVILGLQKPDGSFAPEVWQLPANAMGSIKDIACPGVVMETCFCILFLRRATPKLDETIQIKTGTGK